MLLTSQHHQLLPQLASGQARQSSKTEQPPC